MFDAYTIKKVLPRLLAGVILIQFSWFLFTGLIVIMNGIAYGIEGLIYAPFGGIQNTSLVEILRGTQGGTGLFLGLTTLGAAGLLIGAVAAGGIMATAGMILLGVLIAFLLLLFRQVIIIALLLVSPLAIVAWIMPGTEKYWKLWWESFSKLLLVYPIILGFIAVGRVLATTVVKVDPQSGLFGNTALNSGTDGVVKFMLVLICLFGPFFLIPKTFQMAGGAFATLTGAVNNKGKGAFDRLRKSRAQTQAKNWHNTKAGSRFSERNALTRRVNRMGQGVGVGAKGAFGLGRRGEMAVDLSSQAAADEALKNNPALQKLAFDDHGNAVMALSGGSRAGAVAASHDLARGWLRDNEDYQNAIAGGDTTTQRRIEGEMEARRLNAVASASTVGFTRANAQAAFATVAQNKSRSIGAGDLATVQRGADRLAGGNTQMAENLMQSSMFHSRGAGRFDLGDASASAGANRASLYQVANSHPSTINGWGAELADNVRSGDSAQLHRASIGHQELKAALPNATGEARDAIVNQIRTLEAIVDPATGNSALAQHNNTATGNTIQRMATFDGERADPAHARYDAAYDAAWSDPQDRARGSRMETVQETLGDVAGREARTYERPDPNHL